MLRKFPVFQISKKYYCFSIAHIIFIKNRHKLNKINLIYKMETEQSNFEVREKTITGEKKEINKNFSQSKKEKKQRIMNIVYLISS